jgi:tRNA nucleotidyltransferase (CCA-adding enzyme)
MRDDTLFIHPESGDLYQRARRQSYDAEAQTLIYHTDASVQLRDELATRPLTILAMAADGDAIIDPYGGQQDIEQGLLRHVNNEYMHVAENVLITALWAARLKGWGFKIAHATYGLMKKMSATGCIHRIPGSVISDAVVQAMASSRPSEFFRVLHRCGALHVISLQLDALFVEVVEERAKNKQQHSSSALPEVMRTLDEVAATTDNVSHIIKQFHESLGEQASNIFHSLGLGALFPDG